MEEAGSTEEGGRTRGRGGAMVLETKLMIDMRWDLEAMMLLGSLLLVVARHNRASRGHTAAEVQQMIEYHRTVVSSTASSRF